MCVKTRTERDPLRGAILKLVVKWVCFVSCAVGYGCLLCLLWRPLFNWWYVSWWSSFGYWRWLVTHVHVSLCTDTVATTTLDLKTTMSLDWSILRRKATRNLWNTQPTSFGRLRGRRRNDKGGRVYRMVVVRAPNMVRRRERPATTHKSRTPPHMHVLIPQWRTEGCI